MLRRRPSEVATRWQPKLYAADLQARRPSSASLIASDNVKPKSERRPSRMSSINFRHVVFVLLAVQYGSMARPHTGRYSPRHTALSISAAAAAYCLKPPPTTTANQRSHSLGVTKNSSTFPGLSRTPQAFFRDPVVSQKSLNR